MSFIRNSWKAVVATFITALITFLTSTGDGLSVMEGFRSAGLSFLSGVLVWVTPYKTTPVNDNSTADVGQSLVGVIVLILGVILLLVGALRLLIDVVNNRPPNLLVDIILIVIGLVMVACVRRSPDFGDRRRI